MAVSYATVNVTLPVMMIVSLATVNAMVVITVTRTVTQAAILFMVDVLPVSQVVPHTTVLAKEPVMFVTLVRPATLHAMATIQSVLQTVMNVRFVIPHKVVPLPAIQ